MTERHLGKSGLRVSAIGLGCMGMSEFYDPGRLNDEESIRVIHRYLDAGGNFLDTADMYGVGRNEVLVGQAIQGRRDPVVLATKFGNVRGPAGEFLGVRGDPPYVRECCDASLKRLGVDVIDLYYQHRVDPKTPIEETVGAMAELVQAGKVRYLGLSEAAPATILRAARVHPIAALQTEYSLWTREPEEAVLPGVRELGIGFVAYSPLGRGFLTGQFKTIDDLPPGDYRRDAPRFQGENFQKNLDLVKKIEELAAVKGCSPGRLALAWVLAQGPDIVPIPGTKRVKYLEDNLGALDVQLRQTNWRRSTPSCRSAPRRARGIPRGRCRRSIGKAGAKFFAGGVSQIPCKESARGAKNATNAKNAKNPQVLGLPPLIFCRAAAPAAARKPFAARPAPRAAKNKRPPNRARAARKERGGTVAKRSPGWASPHRECRAGPNGRKSASRGLRPSSGRRSRPSRRAASGCSPGRRRSGRWSRGPRRRGCRRRPARW
jgi:aryl-alcohol dehydrogenase-like predicted oxidoreductase